MMINCLWFLLAVTTTVTTGASTSNYEVVSTLNNNIFQQQQEKATTSAGYGGSTVGVGPPTFARGVDVPDGIMALLSDECIATFKANAGIKSDYVLNLVMINPISNTIYFPHEDLMVSLDMDDGFKPFDVMSTSSTSTYPLCMSGGVKVSCGEPTVYMKEFTTDSGNAIRVQINYDGYGNIDSMSLRNNGAKQTLQILTDCLQTNPDLYGKVFAYLPPTAVESEYYEQFQTEEVDPVPFNTDDNEANRTNSRSLRRNDDNKSINTNEALMNLGTHRLRQSIERQVMNQINDDSDIVNYVQHITTTNTHSGGGRRRLVEEVCPVCPNGPDTNPTIREVKLAIAVDSTFCHHPSIGGTSTAARAKGKCFCARSGVHDLLAYS